MKYKFLTISIIVLINNLLYTQDGTLDPTFDSDGKVTTPIGASDDYGYGVAIQSDGKIVVSGYSDNGSNYDFVIVRYNSDGSLDNGFDYDGIVNTPIGVSDDVGRSIAIQSDGKIVVAGHSDNGINKDFALVRYNSDGSLDNGFDYDGKVTTPIGANDDEGFSVAIQSDRRIVVAGYSNNGSHEDFALVRYNNDGSLDNGFGSNGIVTTPIGTSNDRGYSVAIQSDGKIVITGRSHNGNNYDFAIARYNSDGSLDNGFDYDGKVTTPIGANDDVGLSVAIQSDGKIVVVGYSHNGSNTDFAITRYNRDGSLDNGFDADGKVITPIGVSNDIGYGVAIQSDGKIVVTGDSHYDFATVRYNRDGSLDNGFGSNGKVITPIGVSSDFGHDVSIQSDGKIVVAGSSHNGRNWDFAVVVYNNPSLPIELTTFSANVSNSNVQLNWETATEVNNYGFNIQRQLQVSSIENQDKKQNWKNVEFIQGHGNSNSPKYYKFIDNEVSSGKYNYRLKQIDIDGSFEYSNIVKVDLGLPSGFSLSQNYPNPFNPKTTISYSIPTEETFVQIKIFNTLGKEIITLLNKQHNPGNYNVEFDAANLTSGIYFYRLQSKTFSKTKKLMLIK